MSFYDPQIAMALRLITKFGAQITITRTTTAALSQPSGLPSAPPIIQVATPQAVVLPLASRSNQSDQFSEGSLVQNQQRIVYIAGDGMTFTPTTPAENNDRPMPGDIIDVEGDGWTIESSSPLGPIGAPWLLHTAVISR